MNIRLLTRPQQLARLSGLALCALLIFAAPALGQVRRPLEDLAVEFGRSGPELGVTVRDRTADDAGAATAGGAVVESVRDGSPASTAGVRAGDLIVSFDGERVRSARQLARLIDETPAGTEVAVVLMRSGREVTASVTPEQRTRLAEWPDAEAWNAPGRELFLRTRRAPVMPGLLMPRGPARLGVQIQDLTPELAEYFGASSGVLIASVSDDTPARAAGLRAGDVITAVNGESVTDGAELRQRLANASGSAKVTIVRDRQEQTIEVTLGEGRSDRAPRRYSR